MDIKTTVNRQIFAEDGTEVTTGTVVEFTVENRSLCGIYKGISNRGALIFQNTIDMDVTYNVKPSSIGTLRIAVAARSTEDK